MNCATKSDVILTDLSDLINKYGSDKDVNGYVQLYHTLFREKRQQPIIFLEIGIGTMIPDSHSSMVGYSLENYKPGGSLRAWRDYFPQGRIIGVDVQPDTQFRDEPRVETYLCDSTKIEEVTKLMKQLDIRPDIIIDDGSHIDMNQLMTLKNFYPYLKDGGIYIIEDIYPGSQVSANPNLLVPHCSNDPFFFVGIKNNLCVICKDFLNSKRKNY